MHPSAWDLKDAAVVCHQLGYSGALAASSGNYFNTTRKTRLYEIANIDCTGYEESITQCAGIFPRQRNQVHSNVAEVICKVNG